MVDEITGRRQTCERCGDEDCMGLYILRNAQYSGPLVSAIYSTFRVCNTCYEDMSESDCWDW